MSLQRYRPGAFDKVITEARHSCLIQGLFRSKIGLDYVRYIPCDVIQTLESDGHQAEQFFEQLLLGQVPSVVQNLPQEAVQQFKDVFNIVTTLPDEILTAAEAVATDAANVFNDIEDGSIIQDIEYIPGVILSDVTSEWSDFTSVLTSAWNDVASDIGCFYGNCPPPTAVGACASTAAATATSNGAATMSTIYAAAVTSPTYGAATPSTTSGSTITTTNSGTTETGTTNGAETASTISEAVVSSTSNGAVATSTNSGSTTTTTNSGTKVTSTDNGSTITTTNSGTVVTRIIDNAVATSSNEAQSTTISSTQSIDATSWARPQSSWVGLKLLVATAVGVSWALCL